MECVKKTLLITLGPPERHHLAGANSALPVECFPKEPFNSSSAQQRLAPATRPPAGFCGLASIASDGGQEFGHSGLKAAREAQEEWKHLETSPQRTAGRSRAVPAASPATAGQSLGIQHQTQFVACPAHPPGSEGALEQAVAAAARGAHLLRAEPLHHVAGVAAVAAGEAEVGGAAHGHVADGALEGEALADGALGAPHLAAAVAAVHAELWGEKGNGEQELVLVATGAEKPCTDGVP